MGIPAFCDDRAACCEGFFDIAERIATIGGDAIRACLPDNCPDFPSGVVHAEPPGGGDYLMAWLAGAIPILPQGTKHRTAPQVRLTIQVAICLEGYPGLIVEGGEIKAVPTVAEHNHASFYTYAAAERAYRALWSAVLRKELSACEAQSISNLYPETPAFGSARWRLTFLFDLDL